MCACRHFEPIYSRIKCGWLALLSSTLLVAGTCSWAPVSKLHPHISKRALIRAYTRHGRSTNIDVSNVYWSPNGERAYYIVSESPPDRSDDWVTLYSICSDGSHIRRLIARMEHGPDAPDVESVKWAPDSRHLIMLLLIEGGASSVNADGVDLVDIDAATGVPRKLSCDLPDKHRSGQVLWHAKSYCFSPDGTKLLISLGGDRYVVHNKRIVCVDYATGHRKSLTGASMSSFAACWSPDGKHIAYISGPDSTAQMGTTPYLELLRRFHLYIMNADGTGKRCVAAGARCSEGEPAWSGDGKTITFARFNYLDSNSQKKEKWRVNPDGTGLLFIRTFKSN